MKKIKVLFVNGGLMNRGGTSSFICDYLNKQAIKLQEKYIFLLKEL